MEPITFDQTPTPQELLDAVFRFLYMQGVPAVDGDGNCVLRAKVDDSGNYLHFDADPTARPICCAIGALLPDDMALRVMEEDCDLVSTLFDTVRNWEADQPPLVPEWLRDFAEQSIPYRFDVETDPDQRPAQKFLSDIQGAHDECLYASDFRDALRHTMSRIAHDWKLDPGFIDTFNPRTDP